MVKRLGLVLVMIITILGQTAYATGLPRVSDEAKIFSEEERGKLTAKAAELSEKYNMDIIISTTDDARGYSAKDYSERIYEEYGYGVGDDYSGIMLLYDLDNREIFILTHSKGTTYLTDYRVEKLLDAVYNNGLKHSEYYRSADVYLDVLGGFLEDGIVANRYEEKLEPKVNSLSPLDMGLGVLGAFTVSGGFYTAIKRKYSGKPIPVKYDFRSNSIVNIAKDQDRLIRSFINTRHIPKNTGGGGGDSGKTTTWTSSTGSDNTYGGGGRKF